MRFGSTNFRKALHRLELSRRLQGIATNRFGIRFTAVIVLGTKLTAGGTTT